MTETLRDSLRRLRGQLDRAFSPGTAQGEYDPDCPARGHCAAVALIVQAMFGGGLRSTKVCGEGHWYNRIGDSEIDLTGDQYGYPPVGVSESGPIWPEGRTREHADVRAETWQRAIRLAARL